MDKIILGSGRRKKQDFQYYKQIKNHLDDFFKSQNKKIPKWGKREKEIAEVHDIINNQMQDVRTNNRVRLELAQRDTYMDTYWQEETQVGLFTVEPASTEAFSGLINPFPVNTKEIQSQNYLTEINPPDAIGSKDFYKNIVDALFEKHKYWVDEAQRLKNRILVLDTQIIELKNKLEEKMNEPDLSDEEVAEYNEQLNQIYKGF